MDPNGCAEGFATDTIFEPVSVATPCETPLAAYWSTTSILLFLRFLSFSVRVYSREKRRRLRQTQQQQNNHSTNRKIVRFPVGSIIDALSLLLYSVLYVLAGLNVVRFDNGWAISLFSLSFLPFAIGFTIFLFRTVRLGTKIISRDMAQRDDLKSFDGLGKVLVIMQIFSLFASSVILIICSPIFPEYEAVFVTVGFATKVAFMISTGTGIIYQMERCVRAIKEVTNNVANAVSENSSPKASVQLAIRRMRFNQWLIALVNFPAAFIGILVSANVIHLTWIVAVVVLQGAEVFGSLAILIPFCMKKKGEDGTGGNPQRHLPPNSSSSPSKKVSAKGSSLSANNRQVGPLSLIATTDADNTSHNGGSFSHIIVSRADAQDGRDHDHDKD